MLRWAPASCKRMAATQAPLEGGGAIHSLLPHTCTWPSQIQAATPRLWRVKSLSDAVQLVDAKGPGRGLDGRRCTAGAATAGRKLLMGLGRWTGRH